MLKQVMLREEENKCYKNEIQAYRMKVL